MGCSSLAVATKCSRREVLDIRKVTFIKPDDHTKSGPQLSYEKFWPLADRIDRPNWFQSNIFCVDVDVVYLYTTGFWQLPFYRQHIWRIWFRWNSFADNNIPCVTISHLISTQGFGKKCWVNFEPSKSNQSINFSLWMNQKSIC